MPMPVGRQKNLSRTFPRCGLRFRRDLRSTSAPLLLLGSATAIGVLPQVFVDAGWSVGRLGEWFTGLLIAAAFSAMWLFLRRRALRRGVGRSTGFGAATVMALFLTLSLGVIATFLAGPFLVFGLGLLIAGLWQRNRFLVAWAILVGAIGIFEGFFGITNRLPPSMWRPWEHQAVYLALALATVLAGLVARWREGKAR